METELIQMLFKLGVNLDKLLQDYAWNNFLIYY